MSGGRWFRRVCTRDRGSPSSSCGSDPTALRRPGSSAIGGGFMEACFGPLAAGSAVPLKVGRGLQAFEIVTYASAILVVVLVVAP
jgi:hypothetical protein